VYCIVSNVSKNVVLSNVVTVLAKHAKNADKGKTLHAEQATSYSKGVLTKIG